MINTRIAGTAAVFTFGLAALGGTVAAIAASANAETDTTSASDGTSMTGTAGPAVGDARRVSDELEDATRGPSSVHVPAPGSAATGVHVPFPHTPHSPHEGQGHKGSNETPQPHKPQSIVTVPSPVKTRH
jgi:hypothetical protein